MTFEPLTSNIVPTDPRQYFTVNVSLNNGTFSWNVVASRTTSGTSGERNSIYGLAITIGGNSYYKGDIDWRNYSPNTVVFQGTTALANCAISNGTVSVTLSGNYYYGTWNTDYRCVINGSLPISMPTVSTPTYTTANTYGNVIVGGYSTLTFSFSATPGTEGNTISTYKLYQDGVQVYSGSTASCTITAPQANATYYVVAVESNGATGQSSSITVSVETYTPPAFTSVTSTRWSASAGKNKFDISTNYIDQGAIASSNGQNTNSTTRVRTHGYVLVEPSTTYTLSCNLARVFVLQYSGASSSDYLNLSSGWQSSGYSFTTNANTRYLRFVFSINDSSAVTPSDIEWVQLELGSTATAYEPYSANGSPSDDGNQAKLTPVFTPAKVGGQDLTTTCKITLEGVGVAGTTTTSGDEIIYTDSILSPDSSYNVIYELYDGQFITLVNPITRTDTITIGGRGIDLIHFGTDYGVAVGTKATAGYLDTAYPFRIRAVDANGNVTTEAKLESTPTEITASISRTSGWTVNTAHLYTFGRIAYLSIRFNSTGTYSVGNNVFVGSISGIVPKYVAMGSGYWGSSVYNGMINSNGAITIRLSGYAQSYTFDGEAYISFMFMF